ncbi:hypothetical protein WX45_01055 [Clostridium ljungdahlii DSM 13528]|uniref:Uncharacterized protein n=1 Tax=Clostridium ljungdahlii (strain ATCC 55383 / DSM 13528 / PETC) TaxID=748727 RepID=A0ABX2TPM4_CLOLD|nr:Hypothetical protein CLAU_2111 [Clostridium autoethanogenum DSM 10061]OAA84392.1 hypothetical protein WX45_01055 [Clostridium ljungdahlii DSM 13528]OVY48626.1 hypothetical protein WX72_00447 [Clostridium autoethanogenum]
MKTKEGSELIRLVNLDKKYIKNKPDLNHRLTQSHY